MALDELLTHAREYEGRNVRVEAFYSSGARCAWLASGRITNANGWQHCVFLSGNDLVLDTGSKTGLRVGDALSQFEQVTAEGVVSLSAPAPFPVSIRPTLLVFHRDTGEIHHIVSDNISGDLR